MLSLRSILVLVFCLWAIESEAKLSKSSQATDDSAFTYSEWHPNPLADVHPELFSVKLDKRVRVRVSPSRNLKNGDTVTVSWKGVKNPTAQDWVAFYAKDANIKEVAPIKFQYAASSSSHLKTGEGSLKFRLLNLRTDVVAIFMANGTQTAKAVARSHLVKFRSYEEPVQPRLAMGDTAGEYTLTWVSGQVTLPRVEWGTSKTSFPFSAQAASITYKKTDLCGAPANSVGWFEPGYIHTAVLSGLKPGTTYFYRFGNERVKSDVFTFRTSKPEAAIRVLAFGDMGQADPDGTNQAHDSADLVASLNTTARVFEEVEGGANLVLHVGDISYARGYASQWDTFFDMVHPVSSRVPYMVNVGNHERDYPNSGSLFQGKDSEGECGVPYTKRFRMPQPAAQTDTPWYSFNMGAAHVLMFSTEHDFKKGSPQYAFIKKDLQRVDRSVTPWVIVSGHRPMYVDSTSEHSVASDQKAGAAMRKALEKLFMKYQVDLAIWGHHHSYQRTCPLFKSTCVVKGEHEYAAPVHVVVGTAGGSFSLNIRENQPIWLKSLQTSVHGYLRLDVTATQLHADMVSNDKVVVDSFQLLLPRERRQRLSQKGDSKQTKLEAGKEMTIE